MQKAEELWPIYRNHTASKDYIDVSIYKWLQQLHRILCTFQFCMQHQTPFIKKPHYLINAPTAALVLMHPQVSTIPSSPPHKHKAAAPSTKKVTSVCTKVLHREINSPKIQVPITFLNSYILQFSSEFSV